MRAGRRKWSTPLAPQHFDGDAAARILVEPLRIESMSLLPELWDGAVRRLGAELSRHALEAWIRPLVAEAGADGLRLLCPSAFHRDRIGGRFRAQMELELVNDGPVTLLLGTDKAF